MRKAGSALGRFVIVVCVLVGAGLIASYFFKISHVGGSASQSSYGTPNYDSSRTPQSVNGVKPLQAILSEYVHNIDPLAPWKISVVRQAGGNEVRTLSGSVFAKDIKTNDQALLLGKTLLKVYGADATDLKFVSETESNAGSAVKKILLQQLYNTDGNPIPIIDSGIILMKTADNDVIEARETVKRLVEVRALSSAAPLADDEIKKTIAQKEHDVTATINVDPIQWVYVPNGSSEGVIVRKAEYIATPPSSRNVRYLLNADDGKVVHSNEVQTESATGI